MTQITREALFTIWLSKVKIDKYEAIEKHVISIFGADVDHSKLRAHLQKLCFSFEKRWTKSHRNMTRFMQKNDTWLRGNIFAAEFTLDITPSTSTNCGRREKKFEDCAVRTQRFKCKELISKVSGNQIIMTAESLLRSCGKRDSANIFKELSVASPSRGTSIKKARLSSSDSKRLSADKALAMMIDGNLSTDQYRSIRQHAKHCSPKLYPCYDLVVQSKSLCYPSNISVGETYAEISLQSLIDHTVKRLASAICEHLKSIPKLRDKMSIIIKWGCDGAEQNRYKQKFTDENCSDENLFSIAMVPLQLFYMVGERKQIVWQNSAPSSTRYCRPIKFLYIKETREVIVTEVQKIETQIDKLIPTKVELEDFNFQVEATLILCMIDGKVCNALSAYTSSQVCYLCGATPKTMNKLNALSKHEVDLNMLALGLSPLHAYIRFMECLLHISYRLEIKKWYVSGEENKAKVAAKKKNNPRKI